jgi:protein ImuA
VTPERAAAVARLRRHIAEVAPLRLRPGALSTGIEALDDAIGGWPRPGVAAVRGSPGSGRLGLVLPSLVTATAPGQHAAVVDAMGWLYPPGLPGVALERLLVVRPGQERACWATEQLARSGAFPLLVLLDPAPLRRPGRRLLSAAEAGRGTVIVVHERPDPDLFAAVRLEVEGAGRFRVTRAAGRA